MEPHERKKYLQTLSDLFVTELEDKVGGAAAPQPEISNAPYGQAAERLGEVLVREGKINPEQLSKALAHQLMHGTRLATALVALGFVDEVEVTRLQARILGVEFHPPEALNTSPDVVRLLSESIVRKYEVMPIGTEGGTLVVGMLDPSNVLALDDIRFATGKSAIRIRLVTPGTMRRFMEICFGSASMMETIVEDKGPVEEDDEPSSFDPLADVGDEDLEEVKDDHGANSAIQLQNEASLPPVVRLCNYILAEALRRRASDIHIEPYETTFRIRFRIDGVLHTMLTPPVRLQQPFISRMKILAGMDISIHRQPQDGHLAVRQKREVCHFRVSVLPTSYGEKCVIRLLKKEAHLADVNRLGFTPELLKEVKRVAHMSQGMVLVTGPTGSGKTTTLHAMINFINEPGINIVTLEDPVEMTIPGVNHVPVEPKGGVTFASGLRSILRQDPDVVFVGEMRDEEVSRIAIKAALTGHLVLSTLHTNGVVETFSRLMDMSIEPYLLASSVRLVVAQRLMRRLCNDCAVEEPIPMEIVEEFKLEDVPLSHRVPKGCPNCMDSGYRGRVAVYEAIVPDDDFKRLLRRGANEDDLVQFTRQRKLRTMYDEGLDRAIEGVSTFSEVRRILAGV